MLQASALLGNSQRLDGGAMFGNAPRALWSRWLAPDDAGRIALACRALLIEDGARRILLETGIGAFFSPELRERYGVVESEHVLLRSLAELGLSDADIDVVVLSHLHFDHAGGLLAAFEPGQPPRLLFPRARFLVGRSAYERAKQPHLRDRASFIAELPELLEASGRLVVLESGAARCELLGDAFNLRESNGHTPGMLHTRAAGARARLFFAADLVPGRAWLRLPITMGYDRYPEQLVDEKVALFEELAREQAFLFFTHDPEVAAARLAPEKKGGFGSMFEQRNFTRWDLDAHELP